MFKLFNNFMIRSEEIFCTKMHISIKGGSLHKVRVRKLSVTLIALICTMCPILIWKGIPFVASIISRRPALDIVYEETLLKSNDLNRGLPAQNVENDALDAILHQSDKTIRANELMEDILFCPKDEISVSMPLINEGCNYAKGRWVADKRRPLYSGVACQRFLSPAWACRGMQRPDFSYESFRWQPEGCEMPEFEGHKFLKRMHGKTIAMVGDSLGRQQFQSLMCMVTGGEDDEVVEDVGLEYGLVQAPDAVRPNGWAFRFPSTNTTILYYWSATLCELEPLTPEDPATRFAMHLDRPVLFLKEYLHRFDVLVLNTGHHWNRGKFNANRWEMYVDGKPNIDRRRAVIWGAKNFTVHSIAGWLDSQLPRFPRLKAFYRTISPRHFSNGEWNTGGSCDNTVPLAGGSAVVQDGSSDHDAADAVRGSRVWLLDITALSQLRDEAHISRYGRPGQTVHDCLHWCLPGIPDTWNEILASQL